MQIYQFLKVEYRYELEDEPRKLSRMFLHEDWARKIIIDCRRTELFKFKRKSGFKLHDVINTKEQKILGETKKAFEGKNMQI